MRLIKYQESLQVEKRKWNFGVCGEEMANLNGITKFFLDVDSNEAYKTRDQGIEGEIRVQRRGFFEQGCEEIPTGASVLHNSPIRSLNRPARKFPPVPLYYEAALKGLNEPQPNDGPSEKPMENLIEPPTRHQDAGADAGTGTHVQKHEVGKEARIEVNTSAFRSTEKEATVSADSGTKTRVDHMLKQVGAGAVGDDEDDDFVSQLGAEFRALFDTHSSVLHRIVKSIRDSDEALRSKTHQLHASAHDILPLDPASRCAFLISKITDDLQYAHATLETLQTKMRGDTIETSPSVDKGK